MNPPLLLIADDDADMRALVRAALRPDFPDAVEVADGRAMFWHLVRASYGIGASGRELVIVTDLRMPAYSGLEVLDSWHDPADRVPIVVITSFPDDSVRHQVEELGGVLLAKPFSRASLRQAVRSAVHASTRGGMS